MATTTGSPANPSVDKPAPAVEPPKERELERELAKFRVSSARMITQVVGPDREPLWATEGAPRHLLKEYLAAPRRPFERGPLSRARDHLREAYESRVLNLLWQWRMSPTHEAWTAEMEEWGTGFRGLSSEWLQSAFDEVELHRGRPSKDFDDNDESDDALAAQAAFHRLVWEERESSPTVWARLAMSCVWRALWDRCREFSGMTEEQARALFDAVNPPDPLKQEDSAPRDGAFVESLERYYQVGWKRFRRVRIRPRAPRARTRHTSRRRVGGSRSGVDPPDDGDPERPAPPFARRVLDLGPAARSPHRGGA